MFQQNKQSGRNARDISGARSSIVRISHDRKRDSRRAVMRRAVVLGVVMIVGVMAGGQLYAAEAPANKQPTLRYEEVLASFIKKYDTNHDGSLNDREYAVAVEDVVQKALLEKYDRNRDGKLDAAERAAMRREMEGIKKALLMKYDVAHKGRLNQQEREAANRDLLKQIELALPKPDRSGSKQTP